jgi:hypothetical protein
MPTEAYARQSVSPWARQPYARRVHHVTEKGYICVNPR